MKTSFKPKRGQIDYTRARWAPVINCVVKHGHKILIVRRSEKLNFYPGHWNGISGFLDDRRTLRQKVRDELREELSIPARAVKRIRLGEIFHQDEPRYKKTWIVHPILVEIADAEIVLDWEAHEYRWISPRDAKKYKLLPGFDDVLRRLSPWL